MTLAEFEQTIVTSRRDDWKIITCWGGGSGPSFLDSFGVWATGEGKFSSLDVDSHSMRGSFKKDLSIGIAWGLPHNRDFVEDWANQFSDPHASSSFADFFYNGMLVHRDVYVCLDGGRCYVPLPNQEFDPETNSVSGLTTPAGRVDFYRLLNSFTSTIDYDNYLQRTGIQLVAQPWMR